ncbi:MAG: hypothetical protein IJ418_20875, partial [Clostridia bacterium]|nr:hypothetical protein [Clostridia bacterium]
MSSCQARGSSFSTTIIALIKNKIDFADSAQDTLQALFKGLSTLSKPCCDYEITAAEMIGILDLTNEGCYALILRERLIYLHITNVNQAFICYDIRSNGKCHVEHSFHSLMKTMRVSGCGWHRIIAPYAPLSTPDWRMPQELPVSLCGVVRKYHYTHASSSR